MDAPTPAAVYVSPSVLQAWPSNPRSHKVDEIVRSIQRFGFGAPILARPNGEVIAGMGRLEAARKLGLAEVPVRYLDLPEGEAHALALADNQLGGEWTDDLGEVVRDLAERGVDLDGLGWDRNAIDALLGGPGRDPGDVDDPGAEEPREEAASRSGELYEMGPHRLLCGDSTKAEDVARVMDGEKAVLLSTDPPYGVAYGVETDHGEAIANDENDGPKLKAFLESVFAAALLHLVPNAAWYLWHAQMTQGFFAAAAAAAAAQVLIHRQIVWVKPSLILGHGDYHWRHELCFYGWRKGHRPPWYGDHAQTTVWEIARERSEAHPTQKPLELFARPIRFHMRPDQVCYEPFAGSGSQIIAAARCGVVCRALEIEPRFCDVIRRRWTAWARLAGQDPGPGHLDP